MTAPYAFEVEVIESERCFPIIGWGKKRLPTDRPEWADRGGKHGHTKQELDGKLPDGCVWTGEWRLIVDNKSTDLDGWEYAIDFPQQFHKSMSHLTDYVRRRVWVRSAHVTVAALEGKGVPRDQDFECFLISPQKKASDDKGGNACATGCGLVFSLLNPKKPCCFCNRYFCFACAKPRDQVSGACCEKCLSAELERMKRAAEAEAARQEALRLQLEVIAKDMIATCDDEAVQRDLVLDEQKQRFASIEAQQVQEYNSKDCIKLERERLALLDKIGSSRTPRCVSVTLTVHNAKDLELPIKAKAFPAAHALRISLRVAGTETAVFSDLFALSPAPTFRFETFLSMADDSRPVLATIECVNRGLIHELDSFVPVAVAALDLRHPYQSVLKEVSNQLVYKETLSNVGIACFDASGQQSLESMIFVGWVLEVHELDETIFCDTCGRSMGRCRCSPEVHAARRAKIAAEEAQREAEIYAARQARYAKKLAEEEAERARKMKLLLAEHEKQRQDFVGNEHLERVPIEGSESSGRVEVAKQFQTRRTQIVEKERRQREAMLMIKEHLQEIADSRFTARVTCYQDWLKRATDALERRKRDEELLKAKKVMEEAQGHVASEESTLRDAIIREEGSGIAKILDAHDSELTPLLKKYRMTRTEIVGGTEEQRIKVANNKTKDAACCSACVMM